MDFRASKFDPENDPDRPQVGSVFETGPGFENEPSRKYQIGKVDHTFLSNILRGEPERGSEGFDMVQYKEHSTRPAVIWVVWCNQV